MTDNAVKAADEAKHYRQGQDWEADKTARLEKSEKRAWMVAGVSCALTVLAVAGLAMLAPFKMVVPYVFAVDKTTGNVEMVSAADDRTIVGYQELLDKHWAQKYIVARENYYYKLLQHDYDTVLALSANEVAQDYAALYSGTDARDKKYGASVEMDVKVLSVTLAQDPVGSKAVVRFQKTARNVQAQRADPPTYWVATLSYEYQPSMFGKERDLIRNPLGYTVTAYRVDAEFAPTRGNELSSAALH